MKIESVPFSINFPIKIFKKERVNFRDKRQRDRLFRRNIYYSLYKDKKNSLLKERGELFFNLARELKKHLLNKRKSLKILSISVFGSSLYSTNNKDYDFLVIVKGNEFDTFKVSLGLGEEKKRYDVGVSIKGIDNFTKGTFNENSPIPLNLQSQIIYRTSISLARRHIPIIGYDFEDNKGLFFKNCYSQASDLLFNTYDLFYLKTEKKILSSGMRAQRILSRIYEASAYLNLVSPTRKLNSLRKKIIESKSKKTSLSESKKRFREILEIHNMEARKILSPKRKKDDVLRVLSNKKVRENIRLRLRNYWKSAGLPFEWIDEIIEILSRNNFNEDIAVSKVRRRFPSITNEKSRDYSVKLKEFRKVKVMNLSKRISQHFFGRVLADVGGRSDDFSEQIHKINKKIKKFFVTDLGSFTKRSKKPYIDFIVQASQTSVPLNDNSIGTIILSMVLHHLDKRQQKKMIRSVYKSLRPRGKIILIEDTFPENYSDTEELSKSSRDYLKFSKKTKLKILYFYDWFGNRLMRSRDTVLIQYSYRTMEEWRNIFEKEGLKLIYSEFIGDNSENIDLFPPKAFMVFEKINQ